MKDFAQELRNRLPQVDKITLLANDPRTGRPPPRGERMVLAEAGWLYGHFLVPDDPDEAAEIIRPYAERQAKT